MKCPVCGFDKPISSWMSLKDNNAISKTSVAPRINYYSVNNGTRNQFDNIYACPKCGVVRVRKVGDR